MGADLQGQEGEGSQPPLFSHQVIWVLPEYNYRTIREHHRAVNKEFGLPYDGRRTERRYIRSAGVYPCYVADANSYTINYYFRDPHDAILFSLKYVR
jgi:hypothetical protein